MRPDGMGKPSELPSSYEEFFMHERSRGPDVRHVQSRMPWWNPRYWRKRVWLGVAALVVIVIIIAVAAGVAESKKNSAYPDYTDLNYSLADTCESSSPHTTPATASDAANLTTTRRRHKLLRQLRLFHRLRPWYGASLSTPCFSSGAELADVGIAAQGFVHYVPQAEAQALVSAAQPPPPTGHGHGHP